MAKKINNWNPEVQGTKMLMTTLNDCYREYDWGNLIIVDGDKKQLDIKVNAGLYEEEV